MVRWWRLGLTAYMWFLCTAFNAVISPGKSWTEVCMAAEDGAEVAWLVWRLSADLTKKLGLAVSLHSACIWNTSKQAGPRFSVREPSSLVCFPFLVSKVKDEHHLNLSGMQFECRKMTCLKTLCSCGQEIWASSGPPWSTAAWAAQCCSVRTRSAWLELANNCKQSEGLTLTYYYLWLMWCLCLDPAGDVMFQTIWQTDRQDGPRTQAVVKLLSSLVSCLWWYH